MEKDKLIYQVNRKTLCNHSPSNLFLFQRGMNGICGQRRKDNVQAFTREVETPLKIAKNSVQLAADKYDTVFSVRQYVSVQVEKYEVESEHIFVFIYILVLYSHLTTSHLLAKRVKPEMLTTVRFYPFQCWGFIRPMHKNANIFENHLNPVMLVFIWKLSLGTFRWVPIYQGLGDFSGFYHYFVLVELATSSKRVMMETWCTHPQGSETARC